ncbi:complement C3 [Pangasianodon hypophthalmus]|uniref:complement C3 n=1 Tax=Pangasianodon hypophthalmus TaxID=310915 RepID=UPI0023071AEA|nr:complement C3 [Pangasianodon hypophthalmus]
MHVDVVWLTATFLSFPLLTLCDPLYIMSAPQILRVGTEEQVFVEVQDYQGTDPLDVHITVMNFPSKHTDLGNNRVTLEPNNNYQALVPIKISLNDQVFNVDSEEQQYVYLKATWNNVFLEKIVMVSFQSGYLFIQTDKTIYTPDSTVKYRIFAVNSKINPVENTVIVKIVTPEGITVEQKQLTVKKGVLSDEFKLGNPISNGFWKIAVNLKENPNKNFTAEFEVKEYRLPSFEVNLIPEKSFYYVDDEKFSVKIKAKYLFGETVEGSAFVVFGVFKGDEKISIRGSLNRVDITKGEGTAELTREQILQTFPDILKLIGETLYISVSVLTDTGSEMVEAERRGIHIVTSPYTIHFTRTPNYFKPGMPFSFMVYVVNPDGTPAKHVELELTSENVRGRTMENGMAMFTINTLQTQRELKITVKTNDEKLNTRKESQAVNTLTVHAYASASGSQNYLHIGLPTEELKIGNQFYVSMNIHTPTAPNNHDITYMIISKGQIMSTSKLKRVGSPVMKITLTVTKDMLPSFRLVAYYHLGVSEVVSDSIWVDVKDTCIGTLQVELHDAKPVYAPADSIQLKITGTPKTNVFLVAVDKGVYILNNKNRLTQTKIWDVIEKQDIGCTAGSGKDSMGVFYDAGLLFISNAAESTAERRDTSCTPDPKRKRRAITKSQIINKLVSEYNDTLKQCCRDGMVDNFLGYTCERRSEYIEDGAECRQAFLHCCQKLADLRKEAVQGELHFARSEESEVNELSDDIISRSYFPESWMWDKEEISECKEKENCEKITSHNLPESITTWVITAVSISADYGICVADPYEVIVKKNFFVDLKLPYSAVVNEQIEIKAVIHNLDNTKLKKVYVELKENEEICSMASFQQKYRTTVSIDAKSSRAVSFVIIPLKAGQFEIEVKALDLASLRTDGVQKKFTVVTQGVLTSTGEVTLLLEPEKHGGQQRSEFKRPFLNNQMPDTDAHTYIAVRGRPLSQFINEAISGKGLESLIQAPSGCGEQNLMAMVLPVLATHYLDKTKKWSDVGVDKRTEALRHITTGYVTELNYLTVNNSFAVWSYSKGSTWLTAYVVKMFSLANELIYIENRVICDAINWLITSTQNSDGMFFEVTYIYSSSMGGKNSGLTMTAFVLIALQEGSKICDVPNLSYHIRMAASYITNNIASATDPYAVAMASCALANAGQLDSDLLFKFASPDRSHWPVSESHSFTLEATGYALLALLEARDFERAKPIVRWLKTNQRFDGGYRSTQATAVVFEAIARYVTEKPPTKEGSLTVVVSSTARGTEFKGSFSNNEKSLQRSDKFMANGDLTVKATGKGEGSISIVTLYYTKPGENDTKCKKFDLEVKMIRNSTVSYPQALVTYTIFIETMFLDETREAAMTILDISMLTGFIADTTDLEKLMGKDRYIHKFEIDKQLSERGSLIIYLKKVSNKFKERIAFRVHMMLHVGVPQPAAVTVYEYYSKENQCVKFYDPHMEQSSGSIRILCPKEVCSCAEANCPRLKKSPVPKEADRSKEACHNKDFIYQATLELVTRSGSTDSYTFTIIRVIKEGTDRNVLNDVREFYAHIACRDKLGLEEGKDYLIMGPEPKLIREEYRYTLGTSTWLEYWPTQGESQENKDNNKERYIGLRSLANLLEQFGCTT